MEKHTITFKYKRKTHRFAFTPPFSQVDWWTSFSSHGIEFDVNYDEDCNHIVVYEVINGNAQTEKTLHEQKVYIQTKKQLKDAIELKEELQNGFHRLSGAFVRVVNLKVRKDDCVCDLIYVSDVESGESERLNGQTFLISALVNKIILSKLV